MNEPVFKNYKEKQAYYKERYDNRGRTIHTSIIVGNNGKVLQPGKTYTSEKNDARRFKRLAKQDKKVKFNA